MPVQLHSVADSDMAPLSAPPLAAIERLVRLTLAPGEARSVAVGRRALLVYVRFGVLAITGGGRRVARALPGELVLVDGEEEFAYANASKAEELSVLEVVLSGTSERARVAQRYFSDDEKSNKLCPIAGVSGSSGGLRLERDVQVSLTRLGRWETVLAEMKPARAAWAIVLSGEATVNNEAVARDGSAFVSAADELRISGVSGAELMVLEGAPSSAGAGATAAP